MMPFGIRSEDEAEGEVLGGELIAGTMLERDKRDEGAMPRSARDNSPEYGAHMGQHEDSVRAIKPHRSGL